MSRRKKQTSDAKDKTDYFSWSDNEVELLLSSTMDSILQRQQLRLQSCPTTHSFCQVESRSVSACKVENVAFSKVIPDSLVYNIDVNESNT